MAARSKPLEMAVHAQSAMHLGSHSAPLVNAGYLRVRYPLTIRTPTLAVKEDRTLEKLPEFYIAAGQAVIDQRWFELVAMTSQLKEALDHAVRWDSSGPHDADIEEVLQRYQLSRSDLQDGTKLRVGAPHAFAKLLAGKWLTYAQTTSVLPQVSVPPWSILGWVRKDGYRLTPALSAAQLQVEVDRIEATPADADLTTHGMEGVPLFWAGEGKNRTQLYRLADRQRVSKLTLYKRPSLSALKACPLIWAPGIVVLRSADRGVELLPFGDLSKPLLQAIGVKWSNLPSLSAWRAAFRLGRFWQLVRDEKRLRLSLLRR